ncbi:MAG TPA: ankyrin repeat domain-containing protein [Candidatus Acidoferrum sp.]|nr:ankyrin repeat domain-containing protein [Candidatus Acidoferrum sp.]
MLLVAAGAATQVAAAEPDHRLPDAAMNRDFATVGALLGKGIDPNTRGEYETPALLWLVEVDEVATAAKLLKAGADVNISTPLGVTALKLAIGNGSEAMTKLLLDAGARANTLEPSGESLLMTAAAVGVPGVVKTMLAHGADVNFRDATYAQSALMIAAREGHTDIADLLLKAGADVNAKTTVFPAPAFIKPNSVPGFGFGVGILRGGPPADRGRREPQAGGMTPLLYAARQGHVDVAKLLLAHGAELNAREANDIWPLLMAISNDNMTMAEFLLQQKGVLINGQDWYGRSPIWEAVNVRNLYVHNATFVNGIDRAPVLELIKHLLDAGADPNVRTKEAPPVRQHLLPITGTLEWVDFTGQTPFLAAAYAGDVTVMKLLLQYKADPKIETFRGTSALMAAAGVNWVYAQTWTEGEPQLLEAVKLCKSLGMDVNQKNSMGVTALMGAANRGSDSIIKYLVDQGADVTTQDNEHRTALDWAKGVFLATHPAEQKPKSMALLTSMLQTQGKEVR